MVIIYEMITLSNNDFKYALSLEKVVDRGYHYHIA